jgi:hypothetical protein
MVCLWPMTVLEVGHDNQISTTNRSVVPLHVCLLKILVAVKTSVLAV